MNRRDRRAMNRRLVADLHAAGCTCSPTITPDPTPATDVPNTRESGRVVHEAGCVLGDRLTLAQLSGRQVFVVEGVGRCGR